MTGGLGLELRQEPDGRPVVVATGEVDLSNAASFRAALAEAAGRAERFQVDLTAVEYLDSAGLAPLFTYAARIELVVAPLLESLLRICGLSQVADVRVRDA
jgi:anti-sigma B factor antagonist